MADGRAATGESFAAEQVHDRLDLAVVGEQVGRLRREVRRLVVGQSEVVEQMLTAMAAGGHCLLIGVPGLAKTLMAKTLAQALAMQFNRVQCTPDLMPSDITGTTVLEDDPQTRAKSFRFLPGPLFTNVLLVDEINRTPPKTQAALLEAMQERQVTFAGVQRALPQPFFVIATQNPLEQEGTYPLPEAQLDRFMFAVPVTYPTHAEENKIVSSTTRPRDVEMSSVLTAEQVLVIQQAVRGLEARPAVIRYAVALARATRPDDESAPEFVQRYVDTGAGPRAGQYLILAAKARAILDGRRECHTDDVRHAAPAVLRHRMFTNFTALSQNVSTDQLVADLLETVSESQSPEPVIYSPPAVKQGAVELGDELSDIDLVRRMKDISSHLAGEVQKQIIGQQPVVELVMAALLAGGHCLLVGVPGLAKTTLVKTLAGVLDLDFKRIQFTPDLMPSDITGTDIMETDQTTGARSFRFVEGPVFTNLLLADEINRTPPKTQAALLEVMQELSVTAGGRTYVLDPPLFVLATQNPIEQEGTYPLPEAQLDRFMFHVELGYPGGEDEAIIVSRTTAQASAEVRKIIGPADILRLQRAVRRVPISRHVLTYVTTLVRATRPESEKCPRQVRQYVHCGAGPRASQYLVLGAKARAVIHGRVNVSINDVRAVAVPVLRHRIFTNFSADAEGIRPMDLVTTLLDTVSPPKIEEQESLAREADEEVASTGGDGSAAGAAEAIGDEVVAAGDDATAREEPADDRLVVQCPKCQKVLRVDRQAAGRSARCGGCGEVFDVAP